MDTPEDFAAILATAFAGKKMLPCIYLKSFKTEATQYTVSILSILLTHLCLASHKLDIGKQSRPRSDAAECSI